VSGITTDATDDISSEVALLRAVEFAVPNLAAVLAGLIFIITKRAVESGQLT